MYGQYYKINSRVRNYDEERERLLRLLQKNSKNIFLSSTGRYEDEFIEHRMNQLQSFVNRICTHPILSQSEVWQHFLSCTDDKRWKTGKRKAEKDPLVGGTLFMTIKAPDKPMDSATM